MFRQDFLRALAGLGVGAVVVPKLKDEEEFAITSEDGKMAWDAWTGELVYQADQKAIGEWRELPVKYPQLLNVYRKNNNEWPQLASWILKS